MTSVAIAATLLASSQTRAAELSELSEVFGFDSMSTAFVTMKDFSSSQTARIAGGIRQTGFSSAISNAGSVMSSAGHAVTSSVAPRRRFIPTSRRAKPEQSVYAAFSIGSTFVDGGASGLNTGIGIAPWGDSHDEDYTIGGSIGTRIPSDLFGEDIAFRFEVQGMHRGDMDFVTNAAPAQPGPPTAFYLINVGNIWNVSGNFWVDIPLTETFGVYTGFGLGVAGHETALINDMATFVGRNRDIDYSYTIGAGFNYQVTDDVVLDLGWRFVDIGEAHTPLSTLTPTPSGDHVLDMNSNEVLLTVRVDLF